MVRMMSSLISVGEGHHKHEFIPWSHLRIRTKVCNMGTGLGETAIRETTILIALYSHFHGAMVTRLCSITLRPTPDQTASRLRYVYR